MTAAPLRAARLPGTPGLPRPTFLALFALGLSTLVLLWSPLMLLQQIDAMLVFRSGAELAVDVSLFLILAAVLAAALAALAWLAGRFTELVGAAPHTVDAVRWGIVLIPSSWLWLWQFARAAWVWSRAVTDHSVTIHPLARASAIVVLLALLILAWRRWGATRAMQGIVGAMLSARSLAALVLAAAIGALAIYPPRLLGRVDETGPVAAQAQPKATPDIFIISIDTLAATDAGICGSGPTLMPRLRALADKSTCFTRLYAASNYTTPTTSTLETGALPWLHWAGQVHAKTTPALREQTFAAALRKVGYQTHFISDNLLASPRHHGTTGGYDSVAMSHSTLLRYTLRDALTIFPESSLTLLFDAAFSFLGAFDTYLDSDRNPYDAERAYRQVPGLIERAEAGRPLLVWTHTMPPHAPFLPPPSTKYRLLPPGQLDRWYQFLDQKVIYSAAQQPLVDKHRLRYRESIMGADEAVGRYLDALQQSGRLDDAVVIVTSDHGESFEHGYLGHAGSLLYDTLLQVPLLIKLPRQAAGRLVDTPVSQADIASTIVDLAGAAPLPQGQGRSLRAALAGEPLAAQPVFAMSMERQSRFQPLREGHYAVVEGRHKLVLHLARDTVELFDLAADPGEQHDIASRHPDLVQHLRELVTARLAATEAQRAAWFGP